MDLDDESDIYIADRENRRIQMFNRKGEVLGVWNGFSRVEAICVSGEYAYVGEYYAVAEIRGPIVRRLTSALGSRNVISQATSSHVSVGSRSVTRWADSMRPTVSQPIRTAMSKSPRFRSRSMACGWIHPQNCVHYRS